MLDRREFLRLGASAVAGLASIRAAGGEAGADGASGSAPASPVSIGPAVAYPNLHGDTWATTWADDDALYCAAGDCFGLKSDPINSNLALFRVTGTPPEIRVETVNPMPQFGKLTEVRQEDGACWKASGLASIDGALYLAVARNHYMAAPDFWIQESWDSSLLKSTDHGRTWTPAPQLDQAMFPGRLFANPCFVQYGRDGQGTGADDTFVYAVSNDGTWNNGTAMVLGRVRRDRLGRLNPADWDFVHGFDKGGKPIWRGRHDTALYVFRSPGRTGLCGMQYNPGLKVYLLPQWYYPHLDDPESKWTTSRFTLYQAPEPWGPWTLLHEQEFHPQGFYNPVIPAKFISEDGRRFWFFAAGDFSGEGAHPYYTINMMPVTVRS